MKSSTGSILVPGDMVCFLLYGHGIVNGLSLYPGNSGTLPHQALKFWDVAPLHDMKPSILIGTDLEDSAFVVLDPVHGLQTMRTKWFEPEGELYWIIHSGIQCYVQLRPWNSRLLWLQDEA